MNLLQQAWRLTQTALWPQLSSALYWMPLQSYIDSASQLFYLIQKWFKQPIGQGCWKKGTVLVSWPLMKIMVFQQSEATFCWKDAINLLEVCQAMVLDDDLDSLSINSVASSFFFRRWFWVHCWCYLLLVFTLSRVLAVSPMSVQSCCQCGCTELLFWFAFLLCASRTKKKAKEKTAFVGSALIASNGLI